MTRSYLRTSWRSLYELRRAWGLRGTMYRWAERTHHRAALAVRQIEDCYGVRWQGNRLLEIGCGQRLPYTLAFSSSNHVTAIDTELPLHPPLLPALWWTLRRSGWLRAAKSMAAYTIGQPRLFAEGMRRAMAFSGDFSYDLQYGDATRLTFPDASFDGIYSFSVFEHIPDPQTALQEVYRVLRPGGVFYLDLHLYTAVHGDHDPCPTSPPWNHLRHHVNNGNCYTNGIRLSEWRCLLRETFRDVRFPVVPGEAESMRRHLTPEIRAALPGYTDEELLTTTFIAVGKKSAKF